MGKHFIMEATFVGRKEELELLTSITKSIGSNLVAIIGRRRVGKTMLVKKAFKMEFDFYFTGIQNSDMESQLSLFTDKI